MLKDVIEVESDTPFTRYNMDSQIDRKALRMCIEEKVTNDVCSRICMSLGKPHTQARSRRPFSLCSALS